MRNERCWLCRRTLEAGDDSLVRYRDQRGTCHPWADRCGRWRAEYLCRDCAPLCPDWLDLDWAGAPAFLHPLENEPDWPGDHGMDRRRGDAPSVQGYETTKRYMIDLIVEVARRMGADQHPVSLADLRNAYLRAYPGIGKGTTSESFGAKVNWYTINMRSRFPDRKDRQKPAPWLSQPSFKRVARGRYMLLSDEEIARFRRCVAQNDPMVYEDEYDVDKLIPRAFPSLVTQPSSN